MANMPQGKVLEGIGLVGFVCDGNVDRGPVDMMEGVRDRRE